MTVRVKLTGIPWQRGGIRRYATDLALSMGAVAIDSEPDVIHAVQPVLRPEGERFVLTVHDTAPMSFDSSWWFTPLFKARLEASFKRAQAVIAVSSQTAAELSQFFDDRKVCTINPGVSPRFVVLPSRRASGAIGCTKASIREASKIASRAGVQLLPLAGVPEERLVEYYNGLDYFVDFADYRGFGYPIVEARACGVTVFTKKSARIPNEVKSLTVQAEDAEEASRRIRLREMQPNEPVPFTLKRMTAETMAVYEAVAGR